jgi:putative ABC transport system substrate-binding protein
MIGRREFITLLGGAAAWPLAVRAQQAGKRYMVGILSAGGSSVQAALNAAFSDGLREWGWVEGKNVVFENRNAENQLERLPELAADLIRLRGSPRRNESSIPPSHLASFHCGANL